MADGSEVFSGGDPREFVLQAPQEQIDSLCREIATVENLVAIERMYVSTPLRERAKTIGARILNGVLAMSEHLARANGFFTGLPSSNVKRDQPD